MLVKISLFGIKMKCAADNYADYRSLLRLNMEKIQKKSIYLYSNPYKITNYEHCNLYTYI